MENFHENCFKMLTHFGSKMAKDQHYYPKMRKVDVVFPLINLHFKRFIHFNILLIMK